MIQYLKGGYARGLGSGITWGLDTVLIGLVMSTVVFSSHPLLAASAGVFICSMLHDGFAALWLGGLTSLRKQWPAVRAALCTKDALWCILGALFGGPIGMSFYLFSIQTSNPALTGVVTSCYPLVGAALAFFFLKERMSLRGWLGLLLSIIGVIIIGYSPSEGSEHSSVFQGVLFACVAALGWAAEAVICAYGMRSDRISPQIALLIRETTSFIAYAILIIPFVVGGLVPMYEALHAIFLDFEASVLLLGASFVGMSSFLMWYSSIERIGASKALCLNITYSFWSVFFSFIILGTVIYSNIVWGATFIILGTIIAFLTNVEKR